ncbi:hypothetical protein NWI01_33110 [Nitrobacter winogradskyi]|uniref:Uncharacterized protein n=1 Tax=Nitrobacter winogradskyi TaxID=913 RepID=A0A4Y3WHP5_NITWI|nr:hypothetical protein NWI01_33110 [Nitrobacter winogradskyi]
MQYALGPWLPLVAASIVAEPLFAAGQLYALAGMEAALAGFAPRIIGGVRAVSSPLGRPLVS